jgi:hypothetical protein
MPAVHETAYPRLKEGVTPAELAEVYTPTAEELALAMRTSTRSGARLGFLVLLKTFQRLGDFVLVGDVPTPIVRPIARCLGTDPRQKPPWHRAFQIETMPRIASNRTKNQRPGSRRFRSDRAGPLLDRRISPFTSPDWCKFSSRLPYHL